jgi:hypothetical protein
MLEVLRTRDTATADIREAHGKIADLALNGRRNGRQRVKVLEKWWAL